MKNAQIDVVGTVCRYREMETSGSARGMLREIRWQYAEMASGGDGGTADHQQHTSIRGEYYAGYPDEFFQEVCDLMGWPRKI